MSPYRGFGLMRRWRVAEGRRSLEELRVRTDAQEDRRWAGLGGAAGGCPAATEERGVGRRRDGSRRGAGEARVVRVGGEGDGVKTCLHVTRFPRAFS